MSEFIYEKLKELKEKGAYPFHMPGHKRNCEDVFLGNTLFSIDITEITGYDDLHQPEGMIRKAMDEAKKIYGTKESYFLINSTTAGNLSAIAATCHIGDKILVARNCHKSVYHGIELLGLDPIYLYPEVDDMGICRGITTDQVRKILKEEKNIKAAVIVSPTYEGRISEIRGISETLHENDIPLIVDEAHGAHFIFHRDFPESAISQGADIVIQSLHKTLPSLTQTGILHLCTDRISKSWMQKKLSVFQSSSPSYILMASIECCINKCNEKRESFQQYMDQMKEICGQLSKMKHLKLITTDDISKIVISTKNTTISGEQLFCILRDKYQMELEMSELSYVIAMTSVCDTREGLQKLVDALLEIDQNISEKKNDQIENFHMIQNEKIFLPEEISRKKKKQVLLEESVGNIGADFVYLYPPGIPLIVPGEKISRDIVQKIQQYEKNKMKIVGCFDGKINIVK